MNSLAGALLTLAGAILLYRSAVPRGRKAASPHPALRWGGWLLLAGGIFLLLSHYGPATAVFVLLLLLMLLWSLVPLAVAWLSPRGGKEG